MSYLGHMTTESTPDTGLRPEWTLGDKLRKSRELLGMDQAQFASYSGISRNTVSSYEKGHTTPNRIYLGLWADKTGVDLEWFTECPGRDSNTWPTPYEAIGSRERHLRLVRPTG